MSLEQLDIFSMPEVSEVFVPVKLFDTDIYQIAAGTKVYIDRFYSLMYEVIEDTGEKATIRYVQGYKGKHDNEMTINSRDIYAIAEPHLIPLPKIHRPSDLNLEEYKNKEKEFFASLTPELKMDMITYITILSAHNTSPSRFLRLMREGQLDLAKNSIQYGSSYVQPLGTKNAMSFMYHYPTKIFTVYYQQQFDRPETYHLDQLFEHYLAMQERISSKSPSDMNPFELMVYYRQQGYKLNYRVETDEWYFFHPYSHRVMPIKKRREQLNNEEQVVNEYERFSVTAKRNDVFMPEFELFRNDEDQQPSEPETGFKVPSGTFVKLRGNLNDEYRVVEDNGEKATLAYYERKVETGDRITIDSNQIGSATFNNTYVALPAINRPASLTIEGIIEREKEYYKNISQKEATDMAVYRLSASNYESAQDQVDRAMTEGNEEKVKDLLEGHTSGSYGGYIECVANNKNFQFKIRTEEPIVLDFTTIEIIKHYKQMVMNIETRPAHELSLNELRLAYRLRDYHLAYNPQTDEFTLSHRHGVVKRVLRNGRFQANQIDATIQSFEKAISNR